MVGIVAMAATQAIETGAVTIALVHVAAPITPLARIRRVDHHDPNAFGCGLVAVNSCNWENGHWLSMLRRFLPVLVPCAPIGVSRSGPRRP